MLDKLIKTYIQKLQQAGVTSAFSEWNHYDVATDDDIKALEDAMECPLTDELKVWYKTLSIAIPLKFGYDTKSIVRTTEGQLSYCDIDFSEHFANITSWGDRRYDDDRLCKTYWQKQWLPIASDSCGNQYCVDLKPGPKGEKGQMIAMEFQDGQGPYYMPEWKSLTQMMEVHVEFMRTKQYIVDEEGFINFDIL